MSPHRSDDVRRCHRLRLPRRPTTIRSRSSAAQSTLDGPRVDPRSARVSEVAVPRGAAAAGAGPDRTRPPSRRGPGGDIAEPWVSADRLVIDATTLSEPEQALRRLRQAHHEATRLVIELAVDFDRQPMLMTEAAPYELGPTFAFDREELHHLVWSNSIDGRDPPRPTWIGLDTAVAHGATALAPDAAGDVRLPDGTAAWIDAGPVRHVDPIDGVPVIHVVAVEHGSLRMSGGERLRGRPGSRSARRRDARGRRRPHHRARRFGQDPSAHRTGAASADHLAVAADGGQPRGVQQASPGGDAGADA